MALSLYHQKYIHQSDAEIGNRSNEKKLELSEIFAQVKLKTADDIVRVAVVGCGDKRFIRHHQEIFENLLRKPVEITTFDIVIDHLDGEQGVVRHDCTLPFPGSPFDITYAHVLLRFIEIDKQWDLIRNSFNALKPGGLAIHLLDTEDYETEAPTLSNGLFSVPIKKLEAKLDDASIEYKKIPVKHGLALVMTKLNN